MYRELQKCIQILMKQYCKYFAEILSLIESNATSTHILNKFFAKKQQQQKLSEQQVALVMQVEKSCLQYFRLDIQKILK